MDFIGHGDGVGGLCHARCLFPDCRCLTLAQGGLLTDSLAVSRSCFALLTDEDVDAQQVEDTVAVHVVIEALSARSMTMVVIGLWCRGGGNRKKSLSRNSRRM